MDIVLTDPRVARLHARRRVDGARLLVEDVAPQADTLVNGVPGRWDDGRRHRRPITLVAGTAITFVSAATRPAALSFASGTTVPVEPLRRPTREGSHKPCPGGGRCQA